MWSNTLLVHGKRKVRIILWLFCIHYRNELIVVASFRGRLSRLLTKERSNRGNTEESKYDVSKIEQVKVDGIDTSPLTSPENLAETRSASYLTFLKFVN